MSAHDYRLLESLRAEDGRARHALAHVRRMASAAAALGFPMDSEGVTAEIERAARLAPPGAWRLRVLVDDAGAVECQVLPAPPALHRLRAALAEQPIDSTLPLLPYKTTARAHLTVHLRPGVDDTLLHNERGELTEFTYGNVVLELSGQLVTPPLSSGLLPGIERARALAEGRVRESIVRAADLDAADAVWHLNSVRGWTRVHLVQTR